MSRYTLVRAKNASKTVGLYVDGELVCTHDRTCREQDVELSIYQRFGGNEYTEKVADRPGSLPSHLDEGPVNGGVKNSSDELKAQKEAEAKAQEASRSEAESNKAAPQPEPTARPQKQGKK